MDFFYEAGMLKRVVRSGWLIERVAAPECVASHCWRVALIALFLARLRGFEEERCWKICSAAVLHDIHETRILDLNKITARYIDNKNATAKVEEEQKALLPPTLQKLWDNLELDEEEGKVLKDADLLECALQAMEYLGRERAQSWLTNISKRIKTEEGKRLLQAIKNSDPDNWWQGLKKIE